MVFKDGNDMELSDKDSRLFSRRAALAGAAGTLTLAGTGLMGCSVGGAGTGAASTSSNELTDEQKKLHKQIVATYDVEKQAAIKERLDAEYADGGYNETTPFIAQDPFGTDTLSCYVRFATTDSVTVSYKVAGRKKTGDTPKVAAFSHTPHGGDAPATEHEFKVIGLIPNHKNTVTITCTAQDGISRTSTFTVKTPALKGEEEEQLAVTSGESNTPLADGLFTILGNDSSKLDFMYLYDNDGQIRGEVPIVGYRSHRLLFPGDGSMIMSVSTTKMAQINAIGQVVNVWSTGDYELHHDYAFDDDGNLLVLASHAGSEADLDVDRAAAKKDKDDRVNIEDLIIKVDITTGDVSLSSWTWAIYSPTSRQAPRLPRTATWIGFTSTRSSGSAAAPFCSARARPQRSSSSRISTVRLRSIGLWARQSFGPARALRTSCCRLKAIFRSTQASIV